MTALDDLQAMIDYAEWGGLNELEIDALVEPARAALEAFAQLQHAALVVVLRWERGDLAEAVHDLSAVLGEATP